MCAARTSFTAINRWDPNSARRYWRKLWFGRSTHSARARQCSSTHRTRARHSSLEKYLNTGQLARSDYQLEALCSVYSAITTGLQVSASSSCYVRLKMAIFPIPAIHYWSSPNSVSNQTLFGKRSIDVFFFFKGQSYSQGAVNQGQTSGETFPDLMEEPKQCQILPPRKSTQFCCSNCSQRDPVPLCPIKCLRIYYTVRNIPCNTKQLSQRNSHFVL